MRNDQHRHAVARQIAHHLKNFGRQLRIERRCRLVEQHDLRTHRKRARDRDTLLLAAGEFRRIFVLFVEQIDLGEELSPKVLRLPARQPLNLDRRLYNIAEHRHMGPQIELLKHHSERRPHPRDIPRGRLRGAAPLRAGSCTDCLAIDDDFTG